MMKKGLVEVSAAFSFLVTGLCLAIPASGLSPADGSQVGRAVPVGGHRLPYVKRLLLMDYGKILLN
jgi:hypothetical protein